ncbi:hypothetical protein L2E82_28177 [Cichorium intybus]|uniref:Uncharacterized protein n=1 Tax=Cichorium intybus TaxID=13427 RepID=A0ACB9CUW1_CICIN|nr:hypothetical protein L2E82_28177 [Cichorium intybus]
MPLSRECRRPEETVTIECRCRVLAEPKSVDRTEKRREESLLPPADRKRRRLPEASLEEKAASLLQLIAVDVVFDRGRREVYFIGQRKKDEKSNGKN